MKYPQFTGDEPCAQVGTDLFFPPDQSLVYRNLAVVKSICGSCSMKDQCLEYALHVNVSGIWGGTTEQQRKQLRRQRNIIATPITKAS